MEETVARAWQEAGQLLEQLLREALRTRDLDAEMRRVVDDRRITVSTKASEVIVREIGQPGQPPNPVLLKAARAALPRVLRNFKTTLGA